MLSKYNFSDPNFLNIFYINLIAIVLFILIGYLLGSISPSIIIGKKIYKQDIRNLNSKNAGTTNFGRTFGNKWKYFVFYSDVFKTFLAIFICMMIQYFIAKYPTNFMFNNNKIIMSPLIAGIGVVLGHRFPVYHKFKGGKGAACSYGILICFHPIFIFITPLVFLTIRKLTRITSLSSILSCSILFAIASIYLILFPYFIFPKVNPFSGKISDWFFLSCPGNWFCYFDMQTFLINPGNTQVINANNNIYFYYYFFGYGDVYVWSTLVSFFTITSMVFLFHINNIRDLLKGKERKFIQTK